MTLFTCAAGGALRPEVLLLVGRVGPFGEWPSSTIDRYRTGVPRILRSLIHSNNMSLNEYSEDSNDKRRFIALSFQPADFR